MEELSQPTIVLSLLYHRALELSVGHPTSIELPPYIDNRHIPHNSQHGSTFPTPTTAV